MRVPPTLPKAAVFALLAGFLSSASALDYVPWRYEGVATITTHVPGTGLSSTARFKARASTISAAEVLPPGITHPLPVREPDSTLTQALTVLLAPTGAPVNASDVAASVIKLYRWTEPALPISGTPNPGMIGLPAFSIHYLVETADGSRYPAEFVESQGTRTLTYTVPPLPAEGTPTAPYAVVSIRLRAPLIIDDGGFIPVDPTPTPTATPEATATPSASPTPVLTSTARPKPRPDHPRRDRNRNRDRR